MKTEIKTLLVIIATPLLLAAINARGQEIGSGVTGTKHDLTSSGGGSVKLGGGESCRFCHTPHAANPIAPLWNRNDPGTYYETYESSTLIADVGQPMGSSRLCLSCHDGTIALAQTYNARNAPASNTIYLSPGDRGYLGTDLSDDHPVSFVYDSSISVRKREMRDPSAIPAELPLDHERRLQCTTCHDPHDDSKGMFLRMDNTGSKLCTACHDLNDWQVSVHATSGASLSETNADTWDNLNAKTVRAAACGSCHRPHSAGGRHRLLRHEAEESNCLNCHNGTVAGTNVLALVNRTSAHAPQDTTGVHDPTEEPLRMKEHVECADCHDPHRIAGGPAGKAPAIKPSMRGASGLSASGQVIAEASYEYEVCYKCHSTRNFATPAVVRELGTDDISKEFDRSNASYHPVVTHGRNSDVPSLKQQYKTTSVIYCTDCHGSDDSLTAKGPHGSNSSPLLVANYTTFGKPAESPQAYALCYTCHDRTSILANESYTGHRKHIVDARAACSNCHDPHGVRENTHLINFDRDVVESASNGTGPLFEDLGNRRGSCTLKCHGEDHIDKQYPDDD